jgi:hypothetical protein
MTDFSEYVEIQSEGWVFGTEEEASDAVELCNEYHNYTPWCRYFFANYNPDGFWFILYKDSIEEVLGPPVQFSYWALS